jgi:hypothetical protein
MTLPTQKKMKPYGGKTLVVFILLLIVSCSRSKTVDMNRLIKTIGTYKGTIYVYERYLDTFGSVIQSYDTTYNNLGKLSLNLDSNTIWFNDMQYEVHKDLKQSVNDDSIFAQHIVGLYPYSELYIYPAFDSIKVYTHVYSQSVYAHNQLELYKKQ